MLFDNPSLLKNFTNMEKRVDTIKVITLLHHGSLVRNVKYCALDWGVPGRQPLLGTAVISFIVSNEQEYRRIIASPRSFLGTVFDHCPLTPLKDFSFRPHRHVSASDNLDHVSIAFAFSSRKPHLRPQVYSRVHSPSRIVGGLNAIRFRE